MPPSAPSGEAADQDAAAYLDLLRQAQAAADAAAEHRDQLAADRPPDVTAEQAGTALGMTRDGYYKLLQRQRARRRRE